MLIKGFKNRVFAQLAQLDNDLLLLEERVEKLENPPKKKRATKKTTGKKQDK